MNLCIDSGNTRIKFAYFLPESNFPIAYVAIANNLLNIENIQKVISELQQQLTNSHSNNNFQINSIFIANVAGKEVAENLQNILYKIFSSSIVIHNLKAKKTQNDVKNCYQDSQFLGIDRWCAMIAAHNLIEFNGLNKLVVSLGTALTIDYLHSDGSFIGGIIVPGLKLMRQSLATNTAQLNYQNGSYQDFATNTTDAIYSGCVEAIIAVIERKHAKMKSPKCCIMSGGDAAKIIKYLSFTHTINDYLVLQGLNLIGKQE